MKLPIRVYYEDTDAGGVVYHARYLHFLERARTEFLRQHGFSQQALLKQQLAFVVRRMQLDYLRPARLDDQLVVETQFIAVKGAKITFAQSIWLHDVCLCQAEVVVAAVELTKMKAIPVPELIKQGLQAG